MNLGLVFFQFLPLLLYIAFEKLKGFRAGIIAAILASIALLIFNLATTGTVDQFSAGECALILIMGVVSLKMNNEHYFKFQPTVLAGIMALIFLIFELKGTPLLVRYVPQMEKLFTDKALLAQLHTPQYTHMMAKLSRAMIVLFLAHGAIMAYAALHLSTSKWFLWRLAIYPGMVLAVIVVGITAGG